MLYLDVFDTETASLEGGVCDIAIARIDENLDIVWQAESLIDPERPISPSASGIHHITDDMVWASPTLSEFMDMQGHPFKRDDLVVGGHNVQFDCRVVNGHLPERYGRVCTLRMARNLWPDLENHKLQTLRYMFKLDAGTAHRAMGDVMACISLLRLIANEQGIGLAELIELGGRALTLESKITFGKHKGTRLKDLPSDYVNWLLTKSDNLDPDMREALSQRK